ncbi:MAG: DMT family transporter [Eubacteriales bacterium]|nr:DMT family transporter [Eubacteriales bacterium]
MLTDDKKQNWKVYGGAILFSLIVGFSFLGVKTCVKVATPLETLTYRFNFAFLASLIPVILGFIKIETTGKSKKNLLLTAGFYLGFMALQTVGLLFASSIESGIIFAIIPILAKIIARFALGEKGTWMQNGFVGLTVSAVIAMFVFSVQDFQGVNMFGLVLLFLSSISMALSNVFMRYVREQYKPYDISFAITGGGCILFNLATLAFGLSKGALGEYFSPLAYPEFIIATAFLGIPSTLISALLMAYMLANMEAVKATVFGNLSTAISIIVGVVILKEPLYTYHILCTVLIIAGVIGTSVTGNHKKAEESLQ